ncbi:CapA family protein [Pseudonocardia sp.]|uniref:CapA family protein n=1 Tax=Pseudonocardia sp. TaxID=60912 RepID=UPI003D0EFE8B
MGGRCAVRVAVAVLVLVAGCAAPEREVLMVEAQAGPAPVVEQPPREALVVHATGDVNLDPGYIPALRGRYEHAWSGLGGLFAGDDLTVVNLECPVSALGAIDPKTFNFRCDPAALPAARAAGVEVANLANNHVRDYGAEAMLDSLTQLRAAGIAPVGVGADDREAHAPAIVEVKGWRIAVLGFGGVVPDPKWLAGPGRPGMASGDDTDRMVAAVRAAGARADLVFVTIHWGMELDTTPRRDDVARAHAMVDAGADAVFGHHQHRLQAMETYQGRPIAWGLGNFVWPLLGPESARTAVAQVQVEPDGAVRGCLLPAQITSPGRPELTGPRECP